MELWVGGKIVASEPKGNRPCAGSQSDGGVSVRPIQPNESTAAQPADSGVQRRRRSSCTRRRTTTTRTDTTRTDYYGYPYYGYSPFFYPSIAIYGGGFYRGGFLGGGMRGGGVRGGGGGFGADAGGVAEFRERPQGVATHGALPQRAALFRSQ